MSIFAVLLVIGWRGEPGVHDEPQHVKQGKVTLSLLETMGIPYEVLPDQVDGAKASLDRMLAVMRGKSCPVALVIKKGVFDKYKLQKIEKTSYELDREGAVKLVVDQLDSRDVVVSTTGKTSRELFEYREALKQGHGSDFLTVGSMGHAVQIALGIALAKKDRQVFCFDGDGAVIMQMGSLPVTASLPAKNLKHIVLTTAHDSVGQPTVGFRIDLCGCQGERVSACRVGRDDCDDPRGDGPTPGCRGSGFPRDPCQQGRTRGSRATDDDHD